MASRPEAAVPERDIIIIGVVLGYLSFLLPRPRKSCLIQDSGMLIVFCCIVIYASEMVHDMKLLDHRYSIFCTSLDADPSVLA